MPRCKERRTLMVFGGGQLGGPVVDLLAASYPDHRYVVVRRSLDLAIRRVNLTRYMCAQWGLYPDIDFAVADLTNSDETARIIAKHKPDVVFNATTPFPWWKINELPEDMATSANGAGPGVWAALDCILPLKLTRALSMAASTAIHVNGCYPDMVNAFLSDLPCSPKLGIGNLSNLIPGITLTYAHELRVPPDHIVVRLVCHHYTSLNAPTLGGSAGAPYYLTIDHPSGRLTFRGTDDTPFQKLKASFPRIRGTGGQGVTVSSAATVLASILNGEQRCHHTPGPLGLPGGYPVVLSTTGDPTLDLPEGLDLHNAIGINKDAQRFDGIESVVSGAVRANADARRIFRKIVGMELPIITLDNAGVVSSEAISLLNSKYNLRLRM